MSWMLRVAKLAFFSRVPFGDQLRQLKRRWLGYQPNPRNLRDTVRDFEEMRGLLQAQGRAIRGARVLEIGTGWFPTMPLLMAKAGAREVLMSDLTPHLDDVTFRATIDFLRREVPEFGGEPVTAKVSDFPLRYLTPLVMSDVPDGSLDVVTSRTVLEHIPEEALRALMTALRPKLSPNGFMVHCVDHSDHLEHADRSLSKVQFLTWSHRRHALINRLTGEGENRLRHSDYLRLFLECGFEVRYQKGEVHGPTLAGLADLNLVEPFRSRPPEDLATLRSIYVLVRADAKS